MSDREYIQQIVVEISMGSYFILCILPEMDPYIKAYTERFYFTYTLWMKVKYCNRSENRKLLQTQFLTALRSDKHKSCVFATCCLSACSPLLPYAYTRF